MTIQNWLKESTGQLAESGISTARLDCLVVLQDALGKDKSWILAHLDSALDKEVAKKLDEKIIRRCNHEPLAYIRGKSEFYGREFIVSADTLQPRPETETLIELAKKHLNPGVRTIIDVGTGSGCIATTLDLELNTIQILGTDISKKCIQIARQNAKSLSTEVTYYKGNLLEPIPSSTFHLPYTIVANLPYVPDSLTINQAAMHEPKLAIFGGSDGLDLYRKLFGSLPEQKPLQIYTESLPTQHTELQALARTAGYTEVTRQDFVQVFSKT